MIFSVPLPGFPSAFAIPVCSGKTELIGVIAYTGMRLKS